jgi:hypothetical protein
MPRPPRTERRGGQWYLRRRVIPKELVTALGFSEYHGAFETP